MQTAPKNANPHRIDVCVFGALCMPRPAMRACRASVLPPFLRCSVLIPFPPYPPLSQSPIDDDEIRQRDRRERGGDAEGGGEAVMLDQPADRRRSGADAGVERGQD